jgi:hypothetical protein
LRQLDIRSLCCKGDFEGTETYNFCLMGKLL